MAFSSTEFLFLFLPVSLTVYFSTPVRFRNMVLLATSLLFYTWGAGIFVVLLLVSTGVDYCAALIVHTGTQQARSRLRYAGIALSVGANLGLLLYYKYANFFIDQINAVSTERGLGTIAWTSVALPIGISFFTFQSMSYTLDVARGRVPPLRNPLDFALYVSLFPQLIAGPIVRFHEISSQIRTRTSSVDRTSSGFLRFFHGLSKKVLIADTVAPIADAAFAAEGDLSTVGAWIGMLAYGIQIYFDFSGYSDMAIGLGRILGFDFPENFNRPYSAVSVTDFWRRWHMTLSNWIRDYLYIPLGGNRGTPARTMFNLVTVFVLVGFWHGAGWTFLFWGLGHGVVLLWERWRDTAWTGDVPRPVLARARTLAIVLLLWIPFRAESVGATADLVQAMCGGGIGFLAADAPLQSLDAKELLALLVGLSSLFFHRNFVVSRLLDRSDAGGTTARAVLLLAALPLTVVFIVSGTFSPFLYFQF